LKKHRGHLYIVMRHDFSGNDVVVAATATAEGADNLVGEYQQMFKERGFSEDEAYFYATITTYYDC
jgi:hypothetical protein